MSFPAHLCRGVRQYLLSFQWLPTFVKLEKGIFKEILNVSTIVIGR
jgi:hypothetical protein